MNYFLCTLIPPRKSLRRGISQVDRDCMQKHADYWWDLFKKGRVVAFGPVEDPNGSFGLVILRLPDVGEPMKVARLICKNDPVHDEIGFTYQISVMPAVVHHPISRNPR